MRECLVNVDMKLEVDVDGKTVPAMPDDPFERVEELKQLFLMANDPATDQLRRYDASLSHRLDVRTVPPKPEPNLLTNERHRTALIKGHDSLDNLHPGGIFKMNIGANVGLLQLLRTHYENEGQNVDGQCEKYSAFVMDIDIFNRVIKVCTHAHTHAPHPRNQQLDHTGEFKDSDDSETQHGQIILFVCLHADPPHKLRMFFVLVSQSPQIILFVVAGSRQIILFVGA